jgi:glutamine synthetase
MSRSAYSFFSALDKGFGFCDVVLGWDSQDQLYDNVSYTGWHTGYPDALVRIIPENCRELPFEEGGLFFMGEFSPPAEELCPRGLLRRVLGRANHMGFKTYAGFEYEFFVFNETPHTVREKNYRNLDPMAPGFFGYSVLRNTVHADFYRDLLTLAETMNFPVEGLHEETGPGVVEAAITVDEALSAADKASLFKSFTKIFAQRRNMMATFMAKWSPDWPGQSGHIHISLQDAEGKGVFHDSTRPDNMSDTLRHFVGGQQKLMGELLAMIAPTVNSFTRLIPGFWAPTEASWGVDNRTCALRVITGSAPLLHPACGASRTGSSPRPRSRAMPTTRSFHAGSRCRARSGRRRKPSRDRRWRASGSATPSWITTPRPVSGRSANSASTSRIGRWTGILRLFNWADVQN